LPAGARLGWSSCIYYEAGVLWYYDIDAVFCDTAIIVFSLSMVMAGLVLARVIDPETTRQVMDCYGNGMAKTLFFHYYFFFEKSARRKTNEIATQNATFNQF
jgi:hypothetical protein